MLVQFRYQWEKKRETVPFSRCHRRQRAKCLVQRIGNDTKPESKRKRKTRYCEKRAGGAQVLLRETNCSPLCATFPANRSSMFTLAGKLIPCLSGRPVLFVKMVVLVSLPHGKYKFNDASGRGEEIGKEKRVDKQNEERTGKTSSHNLIENWLAVPKARWR